MGPEKNTKKKNLKTKASFIKAVQYLNTSFGKIIKFTNVPGPVFKLLKGS